MSHKMNLIKRAALAGMLAATSATYGADQTKASPGARDTEIVAPVLDSRSNLDAAWYTVNFQNMYTTKEGVKFNQGAVINTDIGATYKGVSADMYMNHVLENRGKINDLEFTVASPKVDLKKYDLADASVKASAGYWIYPGVGFSNAKVISVTLAPNKPILGLDVSLSGKRLWSDESNGGSYVLGVGKTVPLPIADAKLTVGVDFVYHDGFYSNEHGYSATNPRAELRLPIKKDAIDLALSYTYQNPHSGFSKPGAQDRNVFKAGLSFNLKKLTNRR